MKKFLPLVLIFLTTIASYGQNKTLGVGVSAPNPNAALHVESPTSNQGFIMPRLTTANRTAPGFQGVLTIAEIGLMVYDTDLKAIYIWDGTSWGSAAKLALPFADTLSNAPNNSSLFKILYTGSAVESVGVASFENQNPNSNFTTLFVRNAGSNSAGYFQVLNPTSPSAALRGITNSNAAGGHGVMGLTTGTGGSAGNFQINNAASTASGVNVTSNGTGIGQTISLTNAANISPAMSISHAGTGNAGRFNISNASSTSPAIYAATTGNGSALEASSPFVAATVKATNTGTGAAGIFESKGGSLFGRQTDPASFGYAIVGESFSNVFGIGVLGYMHGTSGFAGSFETTNPGATGEALKAYTQGTGPAGKFYIDNVGSNSAAIVIDNTGTGAAIYTTSAIQAGQFIGDGSGLTNIISSPVTFPFAISQSDASSLFAITNTGTGAAGNFSINNTGSTAFALSAATNGVGNAILGQTGGTNSAIFGLTSTGFASIQGKHQGTTGHAGLFEIQNAGSTQAALFARTDGTSSAGDFNINNASNGSPALNASTNGTGASIQGTTSTGYAAINGQIGGGTGSAVRGNTDSNLNSFAGNFHSTNIANTYPAIQAGTQGSGTGVRVMQDATSIGGGMDIYMQNTSGSAVGFSVDQQGLGAASNFLINNAANNSTTLSSVTNGTGSAGYFEINNAANGFPAFYSKTNGTGVVGQFVKNGSGTAAAVLAENNSNGAAGAFVINNVSSNQSAIYGTTNGTGSILFANHTGASGDIGVFQSASLNVARIDKTGKGFFNGGTQASGADIAEMFDVEGERQSYEPGDVLVISEISDRTVEKSSTTNSTKVIGVYATKPGVILSEKGIDENLDQLVPMGVIGVIPTKVCLENGVIKRGDLLVTSSKSGHAMKAISVKGDGVFPAGVIIGKALENFETGESGLINVLVNVK